MSTTARTPPPAADTEPPPPPPPRRVVRVEIAPRTVGLLLLVGGALWLLARLWQIVLVVVVALILVGTLNPVVSALERRGTRRGVALGVVFVALVAAVVLAAVLTVPPLVAQVAGLVRDAPEQQARVAELLARHGVTRAAAGAVRNFRTDQLVARVTAHALDYSTRAAVTLGYIATTIVLALYLVADRERAQGGLYALVPRRYHLRLARVLLNLETIVGGYMRGQAITSAAMAVFMFTVLSIARVPNALALAVFAALTDVLPLVGGLLATTPAVLAALTRGPGTALVVLVLNVAYQEFESRVLLPRVYGRELRLPSAAVIVALLVGGELLGVLGALLALPIAAGILMVVKELRVELPGDQPEEGAVRARDEVAEEIYAARSAGAPADQAAQIAVEIAETIRAADAPSPEQAAQVPVSGGRTRET